MLDLVVDDFCQRQPIEVQLGLLQALALAEQGGRGFRLESFNPWFDRDGWEVDRAAKAIRLDTVGLFRAYTIAEMSSSLDDAVRTSFLGINGQPWTEIAWGVGKVLIGVVQTGVGVVGIIVPEPGTTVAGVVLVTLGTNSIADGVSQILGGNQGQGVNLLGNGFAAAGGAVADLADLDRRTGETVGRGVFFVTELALGGWGTVKILRVPNASFVGRGISKSGTTAGGGAGFHVGRADLLYPSSRAGDGMTFINFSDNQGRWFLRFVTHDGKLMVNARIFGAFKASHMTNPRDMVRALIKLFIHGARF